MQTVQPSPNTKTAPAPVRSTAPLRVLYAFDGCAPDRFIRICRSLVKSGYHGDSAAYVMPDTGRFYLAVEECNGSEILPPTAWLTEFGVRIAAASISVCLCEHALCLCDRGAVEAIAALSIPADHL